MFNSDNLFDCVKAVKLKHKKGYTFTKAWLKKHGTFVSRPQSNNTSTYSKPSLAFMMITSWLKVKMFIMRLQTSATYS